MSQAGSKDIARAVAQEAVDDLFKNGEVGDKVELIKGRGGRILPRVYLKADQYKGEAVSWSIWENDEFVECRDLEGIGFLEMATLIEDNDLQGTVRTIRANKKLVTFSKIRATNGYEWQQTRGWYKPTDPNAST